MMIRRAVLMGAVSSAVMVSAVPSTAIASDRFDPCDPRIQERATECPAMSDFEVADPWSIALPQMADEEVWRRIQEALRAWSKRNVESPDTSGRPLAMVDRRAPIQQLTPTLRHARTCYFELDTDSRVDRRLAFRFTLWPAETREDARVLEIRWLGGIKGGGERTWMTEEKRSGLLAEDLILELEGARD